MSCGESLRVEVGEVEPLGCIWVLREADGTLRAVHLAGLHIQALEVPAGAKPFASDLQSSLEDYVNGDDLALMSLPLAPAATVFARRVRQAMRDIPMGQVRTYGQLARIVGSPGASRAVGRACGANPLPLVVPCHRVVAASGLGGFALGHEAKRSLLALEGFDVAISAGFR